MPTSTTRPDGLTLEVYPNGQRWVTCPHCGATERAGSVDRKPLKHAAGCAFAPQESSPLRSAAAEAKVSGVGSAEHGRALRTEASLRSVSYAMNRDTD